MLKSKSLIKLWVFALAFAVLILSALLKRPGEGEPARPSGKKPAVHLSNIYQEAFKKIEQHSLFFKPDDSIVVKDEKTLKTFLQRIDAASEFLDAKEYAAFKTSQRGFYAGVGMEIFKNASGRIACFPHPGSPARFSGIDSGDILVSVAGEPVANLSIYTIASKLLGNEGTVVEMSIVKSSGVRKKLRITRKFIQASSVTLNWMGDLPIIKIHYFSNSTKSDLNSILHDLARTPNIVLDLRGNPGGDLYKSIDSAMLFLEKGATIVSIKSRHAVKHYTSTTAALNSNSRIYILQDENTASAAEVFIAALTENGRAESIGKKSYGKGTTQEVFELSDGSALFLTSGYLLTPPKKIYHHKGLKPTRPLNDADLTENNYMRKVQDLIKARQP